MTSSRWLVLAGFLNGVAYVGAWHHNLALLLLAAALAPLCIYMSHEP